MGFTGGTGHVWKTTNAGTAWTDFTANLPDSPVNAVVVYPGLSQVYVGTDVGVFGSSTSAASWTELGPAPITDQNGFLPNVAVTALGVFTGGGQQLLRASTYGRGIWQFNLVITPDFQMSVSNSPQTVFVGQTTAFNGTASALNGYASSVALSCAAGSTAPPSTCSVSPSTMTPGNKTPFAVTVGGAAGDYSFNVQGVGSDTKHVTHTVPVTVHVVSFGMTTPSPANVTVARGTTSSPASFQITAAGSFNQSVTVSCSSGIASATCALTPGTTVNPTSTAPVNMTASVSVPAGTAPGSYPVTIQATTTGAPSKLTTSFTLRFRFDRAHRISRGERRQHRHYGVDLDCFAGRIQRDCHSELSDDVRCWQLQHQPHIGEFVSGDGNAHRFRLTLVTIRSQERRRYLWRRAAKAQPASS